MDLKINSLPQLSHGRPVDEGASLVRLIPPLTAPGLLLLSSNKFQYELHQFDP